MILIGKEIHITINNTESAKPGILFPTFCEDAERILRDEGGVGFAPLNDLYLYGGKIE